MSDHIKLCVDCRGEAGDPGRDCDGFAVLEGAESLLLDPRQCSPRQFAAMPGEIAVLFEGDPQRDAPWREAAGAWVCSRGLESTARLREEHPQLRWIPRFSLCRDRVSYHFSGPATEGGFSFYMPDTRAIKGWRVEGGDLSLEETLARAAELGFAELWLHSPEAASRGRGLELDLLDKTRGGPWEIWLSGGAGEAEHLRNLAKLGGAAALMVEQTLVQRCSLSALRAALDTGTPSPQPLILDVRPRESGAELP